MLKYLNNDIFDVDYWKALVGGGSIEVLEGVLNLAELLSAVVGVGSHSESVQPLGCQVRVYINKG